MDNSQPATTAETRPQSATAETRLLVLTAPERVWLQVSDDADHYREAWDHASAESATWCADSVLECEVPYVRADIAAGLAPFTAPRALDLVDALQRIAAEQSAESGTAAADKFQSIARVALRAIEAELVPSCCCDGASYGPQKRPFLVNQACPVHAADPQAARPEHSGALDRKAWSSDGERFDSDGLDELIDLMDDPKPGDVVHFGDMVAPDPRHLCAADDVIDTIETRAYDFGGEAAEDYPHVSDEAKAELTELLAAWITKHCPPTFWQVVNAKPYTLTAADLSKANPA